MPLIKVHISSLEIPATKPLLVKRLREVMVEKLQLDELIGQVLLYDAVPQHRAIHSDRSQNFVFLEVLMYPGRTAEMKENFMVSLVWEVHKILKVRLEDINCCLIEVPKENWFGGISDKYIEEMKKQY